MIASTFWKKTIQGAISCDQSTCFDSCSCSRKFPAVWKNFFGMIGGRRYVSSSGIRSSVSSAPAVLEELAHGRDVEDDDLVPVEEPDPVVRPEADELHAADRSRSQATTSAAFRSGGNTG